MIPKPVEPAKFKPVTKAEPVGAPPAMDIRRRSEADQQKRTPEPFKKRVIKPIAQLRPATKGDQPMSMAHRQRPGVKTK